MKLIYGFCTSALGIILRDFELLGISLADIHLDCI